MKSSSLDDCLRYFLNPCYVAYNDNKQEDDKVDTKTSLRVLPLPPPPSDYKVKKNRNEVFFQVHFKHDILTGQSHSPSLVIQSARELQNKSTTSQIPAHSEKPHKKRISYAREVKDVPKDFKEVVPSLAKSYSFELDAFQMQAIYHLELGHSVFVAAHTSAGKTAVAEYAIALAGLHLTRAVYTSPIKALSNQKFRDLREVFGPDAVGLLTGDTQIIPTDTSKWQVTVMTTEILRSMLYRGSEAVRDIEFVIFDEVHYINNVERGVVWEEVIIMLPTAVKVLLLSATIPNAMEFADWVGRARQAPIYVVTTMKRPVPLQHYLFMPPNKLEMIVDSAGTFKLDSKHMPTSSSQIIQFNWPDLVYYLKKRSLLPAVIFTFSRRRCDEQADALSGLNLLNGAHELSQVHFQCELAFSKLSMSDRKLPQLQWIRELVSRGIGVHHSGLLPIVKELVEILFSKALIRVLFATETFAMGVNMPARTVVFATIRKHDSSTFRLLTPGEYTQMAGRAGRRGQDDVGTVIILAASPTEMSSLTLKELILGKGNRLTSQFRLTYPMILNLLKSQHLRVEDLIQRSFGENAAQQAKPDLEAALGQLQLDHQQLKPVECIICTSNLPSLYEMLQKVTRLNSLIFSRLFVKKYFERGQIVVHQGNAMGIILRVEKNTLTVFSSMPSKDIRGLLLPLPLLAEQLVTLDKGQFAKISIEPDQVSMVLQNKVNLDILRGEDASHLKEQLICSQLKKLADIPMDKKDLQLNEYILQRKSLLEEIDILGEVIQKCPECLEHLCQHHQLSSLTERLADLQLSLEEGSLALLPEYHARVNVLKHLGYLSADGSVTLKGRVAAELATVDALIVGELLFENFFSSLSSARLISVLSSMVFQDKSSSSNQNTTSSEGNSIEGKDELTLLTERMTSVADLLEQIQRSFGVTDLSEATRDRLNFGLINVVYDWAMGKSFYALLHDNITDVPEGTIVRCIVRLDETCRELKSVSRLLMGDLALADKMEQAAISIKRDICFASSLYI